MPASIDLRSRFEGCLLGLAIGDALGGRFEAQSAEAIRSRFGSTAELMAYPDDELWYTDDTQMAIGVAQSLAAHGEILEEHLCRAFVANYVPSRGYGRGTRAVLGAIEDGRDHRAAAEQYFPGGSLGNGAAMRVAPVGLLFGHDHARLWEQARASALPTHLHPLGIEGAQLIALAVGLCSRLQQFDRGSFFARLIPACESREFGEKIAGAASLDEPAQLAWLGNSIDALGSVGTAIASFSLTPESYEDTIANVIFLGGDTDTLAAMAGAISGAYLGSARLPARLFALLENGPQGREYLRELAGQLFARTG
jgi:poly(ADP-ribose) glycohydrolase ARH3